MIAAKELRIANWVNELGESFYTPIQVSIKLLGQIESGEKDCQPIPLTPEVLEKCGFNRESDLGDWTHGYKFQTNGEFILISRNDNLYYIDAINVPLTSLHWLQNLYYLLTGGEELIYKP
jgi:hypothetical protein